MALASAGYHPRVGPQRLASEIRGWVSSEGVSGFTGFEILPIEDKFWRFYLLAA